MLQRPLLLTAAATLPLTLTACSTPTPGISIGDPTIRARSTEGLVLEFPLDLANASDEDLAMRVVSYHIVLRPAGGDAVAFEAERSPEATLRRVGSQRFTIPAAFATSATSRASYELSGFVRYQPPGPLAELAFDSRVHRPVVSFERSGEVDLSGPITPTPPIADVPLP